MYTNPFECVNDLLDKKMASPRQTATNEDETVDKDRPLDLNPNPTYPRESLESEESDVLSEEEPEEPMDAGDSQKAVSQEAITKERDGGAKVAQPQCQQGHP